MHSCRQHAATGAAATTHCFFVSSGLAEKSKMGPCTRTTDPQNTHIYNHTDTHTFGTGPCSEVWCTRAPGGAPHARATMQRSTHFQTHLPLGRGRALRCRARRAPGGAPGRGGRRCGQRALKASPGGRAEGGGSRVRGARWLQVVMGASCEGADSCYYI